ncbi:MAG TPA: hypothetical protein VE422_45980 [Terriglobia bacterium]|nr:hypothetical protein [Terriglobia bacterium]
MNDSENANSFERAHAAAERARTFLSGYPNVLSVGVGTKQIAGAATDTWCVSVSVRTKVSADQLPAAALIPSSIDGVPTDVTETGEIGPLMIDPKDGIDSYELNTYRPLRGGIKLGTAWASTAGIEPNLKGMGTLGCIVLTNETPPHHVALTNWHVVFDVLPHGPVGQPHADPGSTCCGSTEMIGNVYKIAQDTFTPPAPNILPVDAALCSLTDGLKWVAAQGTAGRGTSSPTDPMASIRDLKQTTPAPPPNLAVKKRGARTGLTTGTISNFSTAKTITVGARTFNGFDMTATSPPYYLSLPVLQIRADLGPIFTINAATLAPTCQLTAPGHTFTNGDIVYVFDVVGMVQLNQTAYKVGTVVPAAGTLTLLDLNGAPINSTAFTAYASGGKVGMFQPFSLPGDSGSIVCDTSNNVVGLLFGGNRGTAKLPPGAIANACHIADVMAEMKVTVPLTAATPGVQTVPANNNPFKAITSASQTHAMAKLQNDLLDTAHGTAIAHAMLAHEREVRELIRTNKRVAARWRRISEPELVEGFLAALFEPALPVVANPHDAKRTLNRFADTLMRFASVRLREDLARWRRLLISMLDLTYGEILVSLGPGSGVAISPIEQ